MYGDIMHLNLKPAAQPDDTEKEVHFFDQSENQAALIDRGDVNVWTKHLTKHEAACTTTGFELDEEMKARGMISTEQL